MNKIIEDYILEYKHYKGDLYTKIIYVIALFGAFLIPTIIYFNQVLFVRVLFWIFMSIEILFLLIMLFVYLFKTKRVMYEYLYKKVLDKVFEDDYTHFEYECYPTQYPFLQEGRLLDKLHSEVVKYRLTYYYLNQRIDLYSLYAFSKKQKSPDPVFDGLYMVVHTKKDYTFSGYSYRNIDTTSEEPKLPINVNSIYNDLTHQFEEKIYISGRKKEIHIAIDHSIDQVPPTNIQEEQLEKLKNEFSKIIQIGKDIQKEV